ncbi:MAG: serine--tRNA ligase [Myxococcota bacterium]
MLDPRSLAERRDEIVESCRRRRVPADVDGAIEAQERVTTLTTELNELNRIRNEHQKAGKKLEAAERDAHVAEGRRLKQEVATLEEALREARGSLDEKLDPIPNFIHPAVPEGGEEDFNVLSTWGEVPSFDFTPLDHLAISEKIDLVDFERAAQVAGQKWYYLKNDAVLLDLALTRFALDRVMAAGFSPYTTPDVARTDVVHAMGFNPRGEETNIYALAQDDLCLIGTAEIPLGGLLLDQLVDEDELPMRVAGLSHCFRVEAGAYGRESRGLYRVHQFSKTEMFIFSTPEQSDAMHDELLAVEEGIFQALEVPYRVIDVATGDLGAPAYRKFDIEAWMPGRSEGGSFGEITSASNCTDYQARRLRARFRSQGAKKTEFVHTLNGTAISNTRTIMLLLEIHQQKDGSVRIPKALQPYMGSDVIEAPKE